MIAQLSELTSDLSLRGLEISGFVQDPTGPLALISPGPGFWAIFTASHEYQGGLKDPMDRWSRRVLTRFANERGLTAVFPFDGPPHHPFYSWAVASKQAHISPVTLLVGSKMGLDQSYRGALRLSRSTKPLESAPQATPCLTCEGPCKTACPVGALTPEGYDVPKCKAYLHSNPESACRLGGCLVRRACPVGPGQTPVQAQFHMASFLE